MDSFKEITFIKQVERTAKRDAYLTAARYIKHFGLEFGLIAILDKANGHTEFLNTLPLEYSYATQTLESKTTAINGELVSEALDTLVGTIEDTLK